jgi:hypothetical protein
MNADKGKRSLQSEAGNKAHLNMHIYYRLMTRKNYQTSVGKRSLTHPHPPTRRGLAPHLVILVSLFEREVVDILAFNSLTLFRFVCYVFYAGPSSCF